MSNVSIYVVDLKRVQPMGVALGRGTNGQTHPLQNSVTFKPGQHVRRSFVKEKPGQDGKKIR